MTMTWWGDASGCEHLRQHGGGEGAANHLGGVVVVAGRCVEELLIQLEEGVGVGREHEEAEPQAEPHEEGERELRAAWMSVRV